MGAFTPNRRQGEFIVPHDVVLLQPPIRDYYLTAKRTIPYGLARLVASASSKATEIFARASTAAMRAGHEAP